MKWWHVVTFVSNKVRKFWKLALRVILGRGIEIWHSFLNLRSSLIIHEMMTWCHFPVKQGQKVRKIGTQGNFGSGSWNMTFLFKIDEVFINYSWNDDMMSLSCQTNIRKFWKCAPRVILFRGIEIWHSFLKLMKSSLIIHEIMTWCHFHVKQSQTIVKIGTQGNYGPGNSNMTSIFQIEEVFINYSWIGDCDVTFVLSKIRKF